MSVADIKHTKLEIKFSTSQQYKFWTVYNSTAKLGVCLKKEIFISLFEQKNISYTNNIHYICIQFKQKYAIFEIQSVQVIVLSVLLSII